MSASMKYCAPMLVFCAFLLGSVSAQSLDGGGKDSSRSGGSVFELRSPQTQSLILGGETEVVAIRSQLAMTTPDYPVTPSDIYSLSFIQATGVVTTNIIVEGDFSVNAGIFGVISCKGLTFQAIKQLLEKKVAASYPGSTPQLSIKAVGAFTVLRQGEVREAGLSQAWGMTRLSEIYEEWKTAFSSSRAVVVKSESGTERAYDLFRAKRDGDLAQDPYVKPGDRIIIPRAVRSVTIEGMVFRPGTYELLPKEGLGELLRYYAGGILPDAEPGRTVLERRASDEVPDGAMIIFDASSRDIELGNGDIVRIGAKSDYLPVIYFEGAISMGVGTEAVTQYNLARVQFKPGDTVSRALRSVAKGIAPGADLRRAFLARKGMAATIPLNLETLLYAYRPELDMPLVAEDRIVIPFGSLNIFVTGEVQKSAWVTVSSLSRLSQIIPPLLTKYSSIRDIKIIGTDGTERDCDLFRSERYGELEQDPYLKPGDRVIVFKAFHPVVLAGEVKRPGTYQLLEGEGLQRLIDYYGMGLTEWANPERIILTRIPGGDAPLGTSFRISLSQNPTDVQAFDSYTIPSKTEILPVCYFEGAIGLGEKGDTPLSTGRVVYTFVPGDTISGAAQKLRGSFSSVSALTEAYLLRAGKRIPVNMASFLYEKDYSNDISLEQGDVIIVPFRQFFVTVAGAVRNPGRYPYIPDRTLSYYVNLAGGFDTDKNAGDAVIISDKNGKRKAQTDLIDPEDIIMAEANSFLYGFDRFASIMTTIVSVASLAISLYFIINPIKQ